MSNESRQARPIPYWAALAAFVLAGLAVVWGTWIVSAPREGPSAEVRQAFRTASRSWVGQPFPRVTLPEASGGSLELPRPGLQVLVFFRVFT